MMGSRILSLAGTSETRLFVLLMLTTGGVGAFVSNTGTVALMLPIVVSMARAAGLQSSRFLMPLAFAGSMGGMLTLIGTPPNLVIRDALIHAGYGENVLSFSPSPPWASSASSLAYSCYFPFRAVSSRRTQEKMSREKGKPCSSWPKNISLTNASPR